MKIPNTEVTTINHPWRQNGSIGNHKSKIDFERAPYRLGIGSTPIIGLKKGDTQR
jgi:hypothetical protein